MTVEHMPASFNMTFVDLLGIAAGAQNLYRPDPLNEPLVVLTGNASVLRTRAIVLLARELVARLRTTQHDHSFEKDGVPLDDAFRSAKEQSAYAQPRFFVLNSTRSASSYGGWDWRDTPEWSEADYTAEFSSVAAGAAQLLADVQAQAATNLSLNPALAALAADNMARARAQFRNELQQQWPTRGFV